MPVTSTYISVGAQVGALTITGDKLANNSIAYPKLGISSTESLNVQKRILKAWLNCVGLPVSISASFNIASVTRVSEGTWDIVFTAAMPDLNYVVLFNSCETAVGGAVIGNVTNLATTGFRLITYGSSQQGTHDAERILLAVLSN